MKKYFIILLTFLLTACQQEDFKIDNINDKVIILGHGGMGPSQPYPMNTFEAISKCIYLGAHGSEIDLQLTKDSILVAYHSRYLEDKTNLNGTINDFNWSEIQDAYYTINPYINYSILSLEQLFSTLDNLHDYTFTFDCKLYKNNNTP